MDDLEENSMTQCTNPATGEILGYSRIHTMDELDTMISDARKAQTTWKDIPLSVRVKHVMRIRDHLVRNVDSLAGVISRNNGKTRLEALATEIIPSILAITYYCSKARSFLRDRRLRAGSFLLMNKRSRVIRAPYGVIGIISPWNYPFLIGFSDVIVGLLSGNAVILKTASGTQMVGLALKEAIEVAGLPAGTFHYLNMPGRLAGNALLEKGIDKLFFTGSVSTGKTLMAKASETLTPVCLELGGKDAMIVCEDADLDRAAGGAVWAGFQNAGQSCGGVERIYVHEAVYDTFLEKLKARTESLRIGLDNDFMTDMGVMTTERQIRTVRKHLEDALEKGAVVYAESPVPQNTDIHNVFPAMVLTNVNHGMRVMQEETFGPVVGVMKVVSDEEAILMANDSSLGLSASVWSKNHRKAIRIARKINAGSIMINDHLMSYGLAETGWGGFKESGIGRTHGELGFNEMTQPQTIIDDLLPGVKRDLWWPPYSQRLYLGLKGLIQVMYEKKPGERFSGMGNLLRILPRIFFR